MRQLLIVMSIVSMVIVGCRSSKVDTAAQVAATQDQFAKVEPGTRVGCVATVLPQASLLAATGMDDLAIGDTVVIITPENKVIGAGHVVEKRPDSMHISYDVNENGRAPRVGDLVVKPAR